MIKLGKTLRPVVGAAAAAAAFSVPAAPALATPSFTLPSTGLSITGVTLPTRTCTADPTLSQPFLSWLDTNWYTLAPGQSADDFTGTDWLLFNGASVQTDTLYDGTTGSVLDMPSGAVVLSPPVCVLSDYPNARAMIRTSDGANIEAAVVSVDAAASTINVSESGIIFGTSSWGPSTKFHVHPADASGWQIVRFAFANLTGGDAELYDFYVDPRMRD